jgi:hypothetical protein
MFNNFVSILVLVLDPKSKLSSYTKCRQEASVAWLGAFFLFSARIPVSLLPVWAPVLFLDSSKGAFNMQATARPSRFSTVTASSL